MTQVVCLINNYNYGEYIEDCIKSVLNQTYPVDILLVIDDGSTDDSVQKIKNIANSEKKIKFFLKANGGQLSAFNMIASNIDSDAQIFFMDSDDLYPKDYISIVMDSINHKPYDFTYCDEVKFSGCHHDCLDLINQKKNGSFVIESSSSLNRVLGIWIGAPTSCISISGSLYRKIFPYPAESDFRIRADDVIVNASSIVGAKKMYIASAYVNYRVHLKNNFHNTYSPKEEIERHKIAIEKMKFWYCALAKLPRCPSIKEVFLEYRKIPPCHRKNFNLPGYFKVLFKTIALQFKMRLQ